ncbi:MAG: hypothetical protein HY362_03045 [Candidatus Aenigmarchaeota archaeon]|nr:hypothetical protein [Candidatus Aenigmarchaeota archaeon]
MGENSSDPKEAAALPVRTRYAFDGRGGRDNPHYLANLKAVLEAETGGRVTQVLPGLAVVENPQKASHEIMLGADRYVRGGDEFPAPEVSEPESPPTRAAYGIASVHTLDNPRGWKQILDNGISDRKAARHTYAETVSRRLKETTGGEVTPDGIDIYLISNPPAKLPDKVTIPEFGERFEKLWEKWEG